MRKLKRAARPLGLTLGLIITKPAEPINPYDNSSSDAGVKTTAFNIGPSYSYFVSDKLDLGVSLSYGQSNTTNANTSINPTKQSSYAFISSVYLRKYCMFGDKFGIRVGPYLGYEKGDNKSAFLGSNALYSETSKQTGYSAGARLEFVYYPSKKLGFAAYLASVNYDHNKFDDGSFGHFNSDNVDLSLINNGLSLSVFYTFGK